MRDTIVVKERRIRVPYDYDGRTLKRVWDEWQNVVINRRITLHNYYLGDQAIYSTKTKGAHIVVNFSRMAVDTLAEYMVGESPEYVCDNDDAHGEDIIDCMKQQGLPDMEVDNLKVLGKLGISYELVYHSGDPGDKNVSPQDTTDDVRSIFLDPLSTFVAWDYSAAPDSVFGAYARCVEENNKTTTCYLDLYKTNTIEHWKAISTPKEPAFDSFFLDDEQPVQIHNFGRVPIIEYHTDDFYTSDIETIISLQDSYNASISDCQDSEDAFANAILVSKGTAFIDSFDTERTESEKTDEAMQKLKDDKYVRLPPEGELNYLIKQTNASDSKIHMDNVESHLRDVSRIPNFNDDAFAGNASGVALKLKLYHLNLKAQARERSYSKGVKRRFKLYAAGLENATNALNFKPLANIDTMRISFHMTSINDPLNISQTAQTWKQTALYSDQTIREQMGLGVDEDEEEKRLEEQDAKTLSREKQMYSDEFANTSDNVGQIEDNQDMIDGNS